MADVEDLSLIFFLFIVIVTSGLAFFGGTRFSELKVDDERKSQVVSGQG